MPWIGAAVFHGGAGCSNLCILRTDALYPGKAPPWKTALPILKIFGSKIMRMRKRIFLVLFTLILCIAADQATKELARSHLPRAKMLSVAGGALKLDYYENKGAVFSFE